MTPTPLFHPIQRGIALIACVILMSACATSQASESVSEQTPGQASKQTSDQTSKGLSSASPATAPDTRLAPIINAASLPTVWQPVYTRLARDGVRDPQLLMLFATLGEQPLQDPMGRKITELYKRTFLRPPPKPVDPNTPRSTAPALPRLYKGVVTETNAALCRTFLRENKAAFDNAETLYKVPRHIAVALLFVETRLGTSLGRENAFATLASMAASKRLEHITTYTAKLPDAQSHANWITETMERRSDWAYKELRALLAFCFANGLDPLSMPGSIYGAIGLCQFMPSNLTLYAADGNNDGVIDLFTIPDAIASLSYYLVKNGWTPNPTRALQHKTLKTYNRVDIYANTILALSDLVQDPNNTPKTLTPTKKAPPKNSKKATSKATSQSAPKSTPKKISGHSAPPKNASTH